MQLFFDDLVQIKPDSTGWKRGTQIIEELVLYFHADGQGTRSSTKLLPSPIRKGFLISLYFKGVDDAKLRKEAKALLSEIGGRR